MTDSAESQQETTEAEVPEVSLPDHVIRRAIRFSYVQAMLSAIYIASTGGMFIIGYALRLGADDVQIGLMSTIPMLCVVVQLFSSLLVERGMSRRRMTIVGSLLNVSGWAVIITLPQLMAHSPASVRVYMLIAVMSLGTVFAYVSGNARASWVGDLIPARTRGAFFGKMTMYAGVMGAVFAVIEGMFLDHIKGMGVSAFSWLFMFGMVFGLVNAILFIPQSDVPVPGNGLGVRFWVLIRGTFANRPLMIVMLYAVVWSLQTMASPFYATYMLRDLKMTFVGMGILNGVATITVLASSPFWGRIVDRYGAKPVLVACTTAIAPVPLVWIWLDSAARVYAVIPPINLLVGFLIAGISVALSTLIYKVTPNAGRAVQFAVYSVVVLLTAAPMPTIGGHLPNWLKAIGFHTDLRVTFYSTVIFVAAAALLARKIQESDAQRTSQMVANLPCHIRNPRTLRLTE